MTKWLVHAIGDRRPDMVVHYMGSRFPETACRNFSYSCIQSTDPDEVTCRSCLRVMVKKEVI